MIKKILQAKMGIGEINVAWFYILSTISISVISLVILSALVIFKPLEPLGYDPITHLELINNLAKNFGLAWHGSSYPLLFHIGMLAVVAVTHLPALTLVTKLAPFFILGPILAIGIVAARLFGRTAALFVIVLAILSVAFGYQIRVGGYPDILFNQTLAIILIGVLAQTVLAGRRLSQPTKQMAILGLLFGVCSAGHLIIGLELLAYVFSLILVQAVLRLKSTYPLLPFGLGWAGTFLCFALVSPQAISWRFFSYLFHPASFSIRGIPGSKDLDVTGSLDIFRLPSAGHVQFITTLPFVVAILSYLALALSILLVFSARFRVQRQWPAYVWLLIVTWSALLFASMPHVSFSDRIILDMLPILVIFICTTVLYAVEYLSAYVLILFLAVVIGSWPQLTPNAIANQYLSLVDTSSYQTAAVIEYIQRQYNPAQPIILLPTTGYLPYLLPTYTFLGSSRSAPLSASQARDDSQWIRLNSSELPTNPAILQAYERSQAVIIQLPFNPFYRGKADEFAHLLACNGSTYHFTKLLTTSNGAFVFCDPVNRDKTLRP